VERKGRRARKGNDRPVEELQDPGETLPISSKEEEGGLHAEERERRPSLVVEGVKGVVFMEA